MTNPFSVIIQGLLHRHNPEATSFFLSNVTAILGTGAVIMATLWIGYKLDIPRKYFPAAATATATATTATAATDATTATTATTDDSLTIPYERKYFEEYDEWITKTNEDPTPEPQPQHKQECLDNMYYSTIRDKINDTYGDIIMCYDHATLSFAYYAKTANIPYKYLETAARKYVIDTNAPKSLYIDIRKEYENAKTKRQTTNSIVRDHIRDHLHPDHPDHPDHQDHPDHPDHPDHQDHENEDTVYVKFKSYNSASNIQARDVSKEKKSSSSSSSSSSHVTHASSLLSSANPVMAAAEAVINMNKAAASNTNPESAVILRERANRYSYRGKIDDFEFHHKRFLANRRMNTDSDAATDAAAATDNNKPISYSEFKKKK